MRLVKTNAIKDKRSYYYFLVFLNNYVNHDVLFKNNQYEKISETFF